MPIVSPSAISSIVPNGNALTRTASNTIGTMLQGNPSTSMARRSGAYFGINSGMPNSDFVRNRNFDLYGQQADASKHQGFQDLLQFIGGITRPEQENTAQKLQEQGQTNQNTQFLQDLGIKKQQANTDTLGTLGRTWNLDNLLGTGTISSVLGKGQVPGVMNQPRPSGSVSGPRLGF